MIRRTCWKKVSQRDLRRVLALSTLLSLTANPVMAEAVGTGEELKPLTTSEPAVNTAIAANESTQITGSSDPSGTESDEVHDKNKTLPVSGLRLHSTVSLYSFKSVRQEVGYDEPITLEEALDYSLSNNLGIKISKESVNYQKYVLLGNLASALPSFSMAHNITRTDILNEKIRSIARVQLERINYPVFQGGAIMYGALGQAFRTRGWAHAYQATLNDTLLQVYQSYNNLLLARILLQIRAKAVEVDEEQLRVNQQLEAHGTGTRFAVMQSDAQLAADRQALIQQQVGVRIAALGLNFVLNYPMLANLVPAEETITEQSLWQTNANIGQLIDAAVKRRPELREYEMFKFGAARNIQVAAAPLYPSLSFFTVVSYTNTTSKFTDAAAAAEAAATAGAEGETAGAGVFGGLFRTVQNGMGLTWNLNGLGLVNAANILGAQSLNRQAGIQANQELQTVFQQVRTDYLNWRAAREQIDNAAYGSKVSEEELRLALIRLRQGVGTNLEVIQAQRDYINALTTQAQAIVGSNNAQAQLLHDTGLISKETLLHGYKGSLD